MSYPYPPGARVQLSPGSPGPPGPPGPPGDPSEILEPLEENQALSVDENGTPKAINPALVNEDGNLTDRTGALLPVVSGVNGKTPTGGQVTLSASDVRADREVKRFDVRDFMNGDPFYADGSIDIGPAVRRAMAAAKVDPAPSAVYFPEGTFRMDSGAEVFSRCGIEGLHEKATTIISPVANIAFFDAGTLGDANARYDNTFRNFTLDCSRQTNPIYEINIKGLDFTNMVRPFFSRITVKNSWATAIGGGYNRDYVYDHVTVDGGGRGIREKNLDPRLQAGGSGLGLATGHYAEESGFITNCVLKNCGKNGLFAEQAAYYHQEPYLSKGPIVVGLKATGNFVGIQDCGWDGLQVVGAVVTDNLYAGVQLDFTWISLTAGKNGLFDGEIARNGGTVSGPTSGGGIVIGEAPYGGWTFRGVNHDNNGPGVLCLPNANVGPNMRFNMDTHHNAGSGHLIQSTSQPGPNVPIRGLSIGGFSWDNGQSSTATYRDGVTILASTDMLDLSAKCFDDQASQTQQNGVQMLGTSRTASRAKLTSDVRGNAVAPINVTQSIAGDSHVAWIGATPAGPNSLAVQSIASGQVTLGWRAPVPATGITDYSVQYRTSPAGAWTTFPHTASTATTITVTGLTNGTLYDFQVAQVTSGGTGPYTAGPITATPAIPVLYSDSFDRPDAATLGLTDGGSHAPGAWTIYGSGAAYGIFFNTARLTAGAASAALIDTTVTGGRHKVQIIRPNEQFARRGLAFRALDEEHCLMLGLRDPFVTSGPNEYKLLRRFEGGWTVVASFGVLPAHGDVIEVVDNGTDTVTCFRNGAQMGSAVTTTSMASQTKAGLWGAYNSDSATRFDNWSFTPRT